MKLVNQTIAAFSAKAITKTQQSKITGGTGGGGVVDIPGGRTSSTTTTDGKKA